MKTIDKQTSENHFNALMRRTAAHGANYERKSAPDLAQTIEAIAEGVEAFKGEQQHEVGELKKIIDRLETKLARPGLHTASQSASDGVDRVSVNGKSTRVLRGADDIRSHYAAKGADSDVSISDFMRGVANLSTPPEVRAVLNTGTDTDGGYMVPTRLMGDVLSALVAESATLTAGAGILALDSDTFSAKGFTIAATDTAPTAAWRLENGNVAESSPGFRAVAIVPRSLSFYFKVSREWLADAVGTDAALTTAISQAIAVGLDYAGLRGSGTAPSPRGVANTAGIVTVGNGANGALLSGTKYSNFLTAMQGILEANGPMPTSAIMSPRSRITLAGLGATDGQPLNAPPILDGMKMVVTSQVPNNLTVGTSTDCSELYVADFRKMVYAMRERMSIQRLDQTFATTGQVGFVVHARADVAVLYPKAFALVTGVR